MATAISYNEIQALYLGLLDRPADAKGENWWYDIADNNGCAACEPRLYGGFLTCISEYLNKSVRFIYSLIPI